MYHSLPQWWYCSLFFLVWLTWEGRNTREVGDFTLRGVAVMGIGLANSRTWRFKIVQKITCWHPLSVPFRMMPEQGGLGVGQMSTRVIKWVQGVTISPLLPPFPTPSSPSPCPKLQKHRQITKNPHSRHTLFTLCLSLHVYLITHDIIKRTMRSLFGQPDYR